MVARFPVGNIREPTAWLGGIPAISFMATMLRALCTVVRLVRVRLFLFRLRPFMSHGLYPESQRAVAATTAEPEQYAQAAKKMSPPSYLTGEKSESGFVPDYPALRNTHDFPDEHLRDMLSQNNNDVMFITLSEAFEVLQSWGWNETKTAWVETTQSGVGKVLVNYGVNGKDVVTTSMIILKLGSFGIRATVYINHKGTELIKLTGYPGIRKILNAPVFALKNPKVVDLGIGKYGLKNSIISGARVTLIQQDVIEYEVRRYIKQSLKDIILRYF